MDAISKLEPVKNYIDEYGVRVRIFAPNCDEPERLRREREYLRFATEIFRRRALEELQAKA